jgi:hypothetical protein
VNSRRKIFASSRREVADASIARLLDKGCDMCATRDDLAPAQPWPEWGRNESKVQPVQSKFRRRRQSPYLIGLGDCLV